MDEVFSKAISTFVSAGVLPREAKYKFGTDAIGRKVCFTIRGVHHEGQLTFLLLCDSEDDYLVVPILNSKNAAGAVVEVLPPSTLPDMTMAVAKA